MDKKKLRAELQEYSNRINQKMIRLAQTSKKVPYERLAAGRTLRNHCDLAIEGLDSGDDQLVENCVVYLTKKGLTFKSWIGTK